MRAAATSVVFPKLIIHIYNYIIAVRNLKFGAKDDHFEK